MSARRRDTFPSTWKAVDAGSKVSAAGGCAASSSSTSAAVLASPPGVFWVTGSLNSSKRICRNCGGDAMLKRAPGEVVNLGFDRDETTRELG